MLGENLPPTRTAPLASNADSALLFTDTRNAARSIPRSVKVSLKPSNSSQRHEAEIRGYCRDISQSGCGVMATSPARVGDMYRFEVVGDQAHPLHGCHARCIRCHLLDEDAFEIGFSLLTTLDVSVLDRDSAPLGDPLS